MSKSLTEEEYVGQVEHITEMLLEEADDDPSTDDPMSYALENVHDELDYHEWFTKAHFGPMDHGAIIKYAHDREVSPEQFSDWWSLAESDDMLDTIKKMAYCAMEADVLHEVSDRLETETAL